MDREKKIFVALIVLVAIAIIAAVVLDSQEWEAFKRTHQCKVVAHIKGSIFNTVGVGSDGNVSVGIGSTPDKDGWLCDDGVTYFR